MAREAFDEAPGAEILEPFLLERGGERQQPRLPLGHLDGADHRAEHQPGRGTILATLRPRQPSAADEPPVDPDGVRPIDRDGFLRRRVHRERVQQRRHTGVECPARAGKRLLRL